MQLSRGKIVGFAALTAAVAALLGGFGVSWYWIVLTVLACFGAMVIFEGSKEPTNKIERHPLSQSTSNMLPVGFGRALISQIPVGLIVISSTGRTTYANPAALEIMPRYKDGLHFTQLIRAPVFVDAMSRIMEDGEDQTLGFTTMQDREQYFEAQITRLPDGGDFGPDAQIVVKIEDRTRDKLAAQTRSDFVANASHELRTPLASILGYVETLQGHARDDPEAQERFLEIMHSQAVRMQRLVDDLMSLSRIEMNEHLRPSDLVDFNTIGREACAAMLPLASSENMMIDCRINLDAPPQMIHGDRDQLSQVLSNIIDNAIKYGIDGQTVMVEVAAPSLLYPGRYGISVVDNGPGIPREHIHRLTERFYRVNVSTSKAKGGTGLGLAIVKHILNRHGGALDVKSAPGEGSTFTVWLPCAENDGQTPESEEE